MFLHCIVDFTQSGLSAITVMIDLAKNGKACLSRWWKMNKDEQNVTKMSNANGSHEYWMSLIVINKRCRKEHISFLVSKLSGCLAKQLIWQDSFHSSHCHLHWLQYEILATFSTVMMDHCSMFSEATFNSFSHSQLGMYRILASAPASPPSLASVKLAAGFAEFF